MPADRIEALLAAAPGPYRTAQATVREWLDPVRFRVAWQRHPMAARTPPGSDFLGDEPYEVRTRCWLAPPDRAREEQDEEGVGVERGELWWRWHPLLGMNTNEGYTRAVTNPIAGPLRSALAPAAATAQLTIEDGEATERLARPAIACTARPADGRGAAPELAWLGWGADRYELVIDADRGVILQARAFVDGGPFKEAELVDLRFDEPLDDALFERPAG